MCSVWYAPSDDCRRLYFTSRDTRVHSGNIRKNGKVAGSIVAIDLEGLGQKVQGVFLSGTATECDAQSGPVWYEAYRRRWPQVITMFSAADIASARTPMRMYEISPHE